MNKWYGLIKEPNSSKKNGVPRCICFAFWLCKSPARWKERGLAAKWMPQVSQKRLGFPLGSCPVMAKKIRLCYASNLTAPPHNPQQSGRSLDR